MKDPRGDDILVGPGHGLASGRRSFPLRHLALRAAWNLTWLLFASWTPPQLHAWRRLLLNLFGASVARGARVYGSARIWYPPNLTMARGAVIGWRSFIYSQAEIVIEEDAVVSQFAMLVTGSHDIHARSFQLFAKPIRIGRNAWVAAAAFVGPGVTVGEGAVLGGAGVAFRDLDPWTVYAGNPARAIKSRTRFLDESAASPMAGA